LIINEKHYDYFEEEAKKKKTALLKKERVKNINFYNSK